MQLQDNADTDLDHLSAVLQLSFQINHWKITNPFNSRNGIFWAAVLGGIGTGIDFLLWNIWNLLQSLHRIFSLPVGAPAKTEELPEYI